MHPETMHKICKFCENRATDMDTPLRGVYIPRFGQISVKFQLSRSYTLIVAPMGVKFGTEEAPCQILPHPYNVSPLRGEKLQNRPLSNLNNGALRWAQCCR